MSQGQLLPTPPQPQLPTYNIPSDMSDASSVSTLTYDTSMFHLPVGGMVRSPSGKERNMIGHHATSNGYGMGLRANASAKINAIVHRSPSRGGMNSTYHQEQQQQQRIHNHQGVAMMDEVRVVSSHGESRDQNMNISASTTSSSTNLIDLSSRNNGTSSSTNLIDLSSRNNGTTTASSSTNLIDLSSTNLIDLSSQNNRVVSASSISSSPTNSQGSSGISYDSSSYSGEGNGANGVVGMNGINTGRRVKGTVARSFLRTASEKMRLKSVNEGTTDHAEISESAVFV